MPAGLDFDFNSHIRRGGRWPTVVDSYGRPIGELQILGGITRPFQAIAKCTQHGARVKCSRWRGWRVGREPAAAVEAALVKWLLDGHGVPTAAAHGLVPRA